ncbi:MAG: response regulator, partial [Gammaproteobacteria bacterium]|nr:response regulator [Gammaproteobacteria bacterium]
MAIAERELAANIDDASSAAMPAEPGAAARPVILCVDDEPAILSALRRLLRRAGYGVLLAESGQAGIELLEQHEVELIISDMRMPGMSGAEFLARARTIAPDALRMLLTGYADLDSALRAVNEGGIYRYLQKPWHDEDLKLSIAGAVEQYELRVEKQRLQALTEQQNEALREMNASLEERVTSRTHELRQANQRLQEHFRDTVSMFSRLCELREPGTSGHAQRVAGLADALGRALGMPEAELGDLNNAAMLHDIGKLALYPGEAASRSGQSGAPRENVERRCAEIGEAVLALLEPLAEAARLTGHQSENFDGSGGPEGLCGEAIPLGSRILALANDYDEYIQGWRTGSVLEDGQALAYLSSHSGSRYDPRLVAELGKLLDQRSSEPVYETL